MSEFETLKKAGASFIARVEEMEGQEGHFDWSAIERLAKVFSEELAEDGINAKVAYPYLIKLLNEGLDDVFVEGA